MIVLGRVIVGLGMLGLGRQLFWLFVGGIGFLFGLNIAGSLLAGQSETTALLFALVIGLIGAVAALFLQRLAVNTAGFVGGGVIAVQLIEAMALEVGSTLVPFIMGGVIGLILVSILFDWALILLSSLAGGTGDCGGGGVGTAVVPHHDCRFCPCWHRHPGQPNAA